MFETGTIDSRLEEIPSLVSGSRADKVILQSSEVVQILRDQCDPQRMILG